MSVQEATQKQLDYLKVAGCLTDANEALGAIALNLARTLDQGAGLAQAATAAQLRATLTEIAKSKGEEDDEFTAWASGLSVAGISGLGNPKES